MNIFSGGIVLVLKDIVKELILGFQEKRTYWVERDIKVEPETGRINAFIVPAWEGLLAKR